MNYYVYPGIPRIKMKKEVNLWAIANEVAERCGYTLEQLLQRKKPPKIVAGRYVIMWEIKMRTKASLSEIGTIFGKDHTTVLHGLRTVKDAIDVNDPIYSFVAPWLFGKEKTDLQERMDHMGGRKRLFNDNDIEEINDMKARGESVHRIAYKFKCSISSIRNYLKK